MTATIARDEVLKVEHELINNVFEVFRTSDEKEMEQKLMFIYGVVSMTNSLLNEGNKYK